MGNTLATDTIPILVSMIDVHNAKAQDQFYFANVSTLTAQAERHLLDREEDVVWAAEVHKLRAETGFLASEARSARTCTCHVTIEQGATSASSRCHVTIGQVPRQQGGE